MTRARLLRVLTGATIVVAVTLLYVFVLSRGRWP